MSNIIKFVLNGCDISFIAEAPEDITLKALLKQCDKIKPNWCACGICSVEKDGFKHEPEAEIIIGYDWIRKANDDVACTIVDKEEEKFEPGDNDGVPIPVSIGNKWADTCNRLGKLRETYNLSHTE